MSTPYMSDKPYKDNSARAVIFISFLNISALKFKKAPILIIFFINIRYFSYQNKVVIYSIHIMMAPSQCRNPIISHLSSHALSTWNDVAATSKISSKITDTSVITQKNLLLRLNPNTDLFSLR